MRKAHLGVLVGLLCGLALSGCSLADGAGEHAEQARDAAGQAVGDAKDAADAAGKAVGDATDSAGAAVGKGRACAEALGLTNLLPNGQDLAKLRDEAGERAQRLEELARNVDGNEVRNALFRVADFFVEMEQRKADTLGELNTWVQRNIERVDDLRTICL